jgi:hypothetical protein
MPHHEKQETHIYMVAGVLCMQLDYQPGFRQSAALGSVVNPHWNLVRGVLLAETTSDLKTPQMRDLSMPTALV